MQLNPYLHFNGNCEEAFKFYAQLLGGKIDAMTTFEGTPAADHAPAEWRKKILHANLSAKGHVLMGSDVPPNAPGGYQPPKGFSVSFSNDDPAEAERIFKALSESGNTTMPMQKTFWAERFGMCVDRFGIPWIVNCTTASSVSAGNKS
ncbi:MAG TPA: VOC family protein [Candidatus Acidoferrales bacterium]|jgi:PhnB protein|nr:VOC family protein [Candidatus Acidoferrales bacterium]